MLDNSNSILVLADFSYFQYFTLFGAVSEFYKKHKEEADILIKPPEETDQSNLPDLLVSDNFKKILRLQTMRRLETIEYLTKANFQDEIDSSDRVDILFAADSMLSGSFRKKLYVEYKAQRKLMKKSYDVFKIKDYITKVILKELEAEDKYGYKIVQVDGAEADDVIACICKNIGKEYKLVVLYASDKDFIQLENVQQFNLFGKKIECKIGDVEVTPKEYLAVKTLIGDASDNIKKVFSGVGPKKALKLVHDKELLKSKLSQDQAAVKQFLLNQQLISFDNIPKDLENIIVESARNKLSQNKKEEKVDFHDFMLL